MHVIQHLLYFCKFFLHIVTVSLSQLFNSSCSISTKGIVRISQHSSTRHQHTASLEPKLLWRLIRKPSTPSQNYMRKQDWYKCESTNRSILIIRIHKFMVGFFCTWIPLLQIIFITIRHFLLQHRHNTQSQCKNRIHCRCHVPDISQ